MNFFLIFQYVYIGDVPHGPTTAVHGRTFVRVPQSHTSIIWLNNVVSIRGPVGEQPYFGFDEIRISGFINIAAARWRRYFRQGDQWRNNQNREHAYGHYNFDADVWDLRRLFNMEPPSEDGEI
ncbi:uncharacterized protein LOC118646881 [Monomorium pharaonis]|uniref:uncharacterized protein LOC118646881 n=1 Tax=Monomorium pharaonis TaxID=307658 RepID=UPI001746DD62|nr:uncharacterized protein LOC118646881 [Monomorium pharaonis]